MPIWESMPALRRHVQRALNVGRRWRAGLRLRAESVSPEVPNDLFVAHQSIYRFFARYADGRRVLDIGCGSGHGTRVLMDGEAVEVVGVDLDPRTVVYATRRFGGPKSIFRVADAEALPEDLGQFDLIVSSNTLEHLHRPALALDWVAEHLRKSGVFILAVPPIFDRADEEVHRDIRFHRSNLRVEVWRGLLEERFVDVRCVRHLPPQALSPDFTSPHPSRLESTSFRFEILQSCKKLGAESLTAIFLANGPGSLRGRTARPGGPTAQTPSEASPQTDEGVCVEPTRAPGGGVPFPPSRVGRGSRGWG